MACFIVHHRLKRIFLIGLIMSGLRTPLLAVDLNEGRSVMQEWIDVEKALSREAAEWRKQEASLEDRIAVLQQEQDFLREKVRKYRSGIDDLDSRAGKLRAKAARVEKHQATLEGFVETWEVRLRELRNVWPPPLRDKLASLYQRMPPDVENTTLGVAERMQTVTGILTEVQQFDGKLTLSRELRTLESGDEMEVQVLYLGLAQAYYLGPDRSNAGYGIPGEAGWAWTSQPALAGAIEKVIEIHESTTAEGAFVSLPLQIRKP